MVDGDDYECKHFRLGEKKTTFRMINEGLYTRTVIIPILFSLFFFFSSNRKPPSSRVYFSYSR